MMTVEVIHAWQAALGAANVSTEPATLERVQTTTFPTKNRVLAVLEPADADEVRAVARIAGEHGVLLHPVSRGRNWGLGSRAPFADGAAIIALHRLARITDYDPTMGTVSIEAGVTFAQLDAFLVERRSPFYHPAIGGPGDASVLANLLERGERSGSGSGRLANLADLDVALGSGEQVHTGFGRFGDSRVRGVHPWGGGPSMNGLFTQSNLGIVTRATLILARRPSFVVQVQLTMSDMAALGATIDVVRELLQAGALQPNATAFWNSYKMLSIKGRYPWGKGIEPPLDLRTMGEGKEPWLCTAEIHAPTSEVAEALGGHVRDRLRPVAGEVMFEVLDNSDPSFQIGAPTNENMSSAYFRKRGERFELPLDPDRDRCGLSWICPTIPIESGAVDDVMRRSETAMRAHGFEPNLGMFCSTDRVAHGFVAIVYDRDVPSEDERAVQCHDALFEELVHAGYLPYRLGLQAGLTSLPDGRGDTDALARRITRAADPHGVLAASRYHR